MSPRRSTSFGISRSGGSSLFPSTTSSGRPGATGKRYGAGRVLRPWLSRGSPPLGSTSIGAAGTDAERVADLQMARQYMRDAKATPRDLGVTDAATAGLLARGDLKRAMVTTKCPYCNGVAQAESFPKGGPSSVASANTRFCRSCCSWRRQRRSPLPRQHPARLRPARQSRRARRSSLSLTRAHSPSRSRWLPARSAGPCYALAKATQGSVAAKRAVMSSCAIPGPSRSFCFPLPRSRRCRCSSCSRRAPPAGNRSQRTPPRSCGPRSERRPRYAARRCAACF